SNRIPYTTLFRSSTEELLKKIKLNKPNQFKQTLIHGDYTIDNVLVHNGVISGVIDWAGGAYGDPRYDVSLAVRPKPNAFENVLERELFFEGYGGKIIKNEEFDYFVNGLYEFFGWRKLLKVSGKGLWNDRRSGGHKKRRNTL